MTINGIKLENNNRYQKCKPKPQRYASTMGGGRVGVEKKKIWRYREDGKQLEILPWIGEPL